MTKRESWNLQTRVLERRLGEKVPPSAEKVGPSVNEINEGGTGMLYLLYRLH